MKSILLVGIVIGLLFTRVYAQQSCTYSIIGTILDAESGKPVSDVTIFIQGMAKGAHSNELGTFCISALCAGNYTLVCKHLNHEAAVFPFEITNKDVQKTLYMKCHTDTLHQVLIKGAKIHWEDIRVSHTIQGNELVNNTALTLGKTLEKITGVYNLSTGQHIQKPVIRGMHSNRVVILNNEIRQEGQQWGLEHAPEVDMGTAQRIEVIKGAQTIRYGGDIIGGLILVEPTPYQAYQPWHGECKTQIFSNGKGASLHTMFENVSALHPALRWRIQQRTSMSGNTQTPDYVLKNTGMRAFNYAGSVGWVQKKWDAGVYMSAVHSDIGIFAGSHIGNISDLEQAIQATRPIDSSNFTYRIGFPRQTLHHHLVKGTVNINIDPYHVLHVIYGFQRNVRREYDKTLQTKNPDGSYKPALHFNLQTHSLDITNTWKPKGALHGEWGITQLYQRNEYYGSYFIPNFDKGQQGIFAIAQWHKHAFSIDGGLRFDNHRYSVLRWVQQTLTGTQHHYTGWAGSVAMRYQLPYVTIHLNMGSAWRPPAINELYSYGVHHSAGSFEIGDLQLQPERNFHTAATIDYNFKHKINGELTFFHNLIRHYIYLQPVLPATLTIRGAFPTFQYSGIDARFYGIEWSQSLQIHRKIVWYQKAQVTYAQQLATHNYLFGIPPARFESSLEATVKQIRQHSFFVELQIQHTLQQKRYVAHADYAAPPPAYTLCHATVIWQIGEKRFQLSANNLLNVRYRDYLNRMRYFADETGRNISLQCYIPFQVKPQQIHH